MTIPEKNLYKIKDCGDFIPTSTTENNHKEAAKVAASAISSGKLISLGGGHDYAFVDGKAFVDHCRLIKQKPFIINFDAHLDVRNLKKGITSGTPFYRLREYAPDADFLLCGIQPQCNSPNHWQWAKKNKFKVLSLEETLLKNISKNLKKNRLTYLSVDIDCFSNAWAPGCSQSWATGLSPDVFFTILKYLKKNLNIHALGIYEVSPPLDSDDRTSKLAAQIMDAYLRP